jgi:hypothetical protein
MVLKEVAKPISLMLCLLSLCAVFHTAFLGSPSGLHERIWDSLELLALSGGIALASGLIFGESTQKPQAGSAWLASTLPMQLFWWASGLMLLLFVGSWYLETYCIFYRNVHF